MIIVTEFEIKSFENIPAKLRTEIWNESFSDYVPPINMTEKQLDSRLAEFKLSFHKSAVCFDGRQGVGIILYGYDDSLAWIGGLAVIECYRNKGVASLLMAYALQLAKESKLTWLTLEVLTTNSRALKFYKKEAFCLNQTLYFLTGTKPILLNKKSYLEKENFSNKEETTEIPWQNKRVRGHDSFTLRSSKKEKIGTLVSGLRGKEIVIYQLDLKNWEELSSVIFGMFDYYSKAESFSSFNLGLMDDQLAEFYKLGAHKKLSQYQLIKKIE